MTDKYQQVPTYCRICEPQCALVAEVDTSGEQDQVVRLLPDREHPVHKGFACHKGLNFVELHNDPDRNNFPLKRTNAKSAPQPAFAQVGWDAAAEDIAARIRTLTDDHGSEALAMYIGNPSAFNSTGRDAARRFARTLGVKYAFGSGTQDCTNKFAASEVIYGTANLHPIPDFKHTRFLLSLGSNPKISHASFVHMTDPMGALRQIVGRGGTVKHVNPRKTESVTPTTGDLVQVNPDTDVYLLAAMLNVIDTNGLQDDDAIAKHADNIEVLRAFVAAYSPQTVAPVVGISAAEITALATDFAAADGASVHMSTGVNMSRQGTLAYWLVQMLSLVTGNLGRRGGNIYSPGYFPAATVGKPRGDDPFFNTEFGEIRRILGNLPGNLLADYIESGRVHGLICMSGNPLLSIAGESRLAEALKKLDLLVVVDIYPNATAGFADFVLPATDWLEREDINSVSLGFQPEPYLQYTEAVVKPKYERREEWWIFARLLNAMGLPSVLDTGNETPNRIARQLAKSAVGLDDLLEASSNTVRLPDPAPSLVFEVGVQREERRLDCGPELIQRGFDACREQFESLAAAIEDDTSLKLITLRTNYMVNSWLHNLPSLKREHVLDNPLHIHPQDLERLALDAGDEVEVSSSYGRIVATVKEDESLKPGVVAMTHGWGHGPNQRLSLASNHPGTNVNALLPTGPGSFDPLSNMSHMTGVPVEIRRSA